MWLLLALSACESPPSPAAPTPNRSALDQKNGFRRAVLGRSVSEISGLSRAPEQDAADGTVLAWIREDEERTLGPLPLAAVVYRSYDDRLISVMLRAAGQDRCDLLADALIARYGAPDAQAPDALTWTGEEVGLNYVYGPSVETCVAEILSLPLDRERLDARAREVRAAADAL